MSYQGTLLRKSPEVITLEQQLEALTEARAHALAIRDEALALKRVLDAQWVEVEAKLRAARHSRG